MVIVCLIYGQGASPCDGQGGLPARKTDSIDALPNESFPCSAVDGTSTSHDSSVEYRCGARRSRHPQEGLRFFSYRCITAIREQLALFSFGANSTGPTVGKRSIFVLDATRVFASNGDSVLLA
jgi:hypothetical protein